MIWKTVAGRKVGARAARELLRLGRTETLERFTSKAGKTLDARLKLEAGEVRFDFGA